MASKLNSLEDIPKLNLLKNLLVYSKNGVVPISDLIEMGKSIKKITLGEITDWFEECKDEDNLLKLSKCIAKLQTLGFVSNSIREDIVFLANYRLSEIYRNN